MRLKELAYALGIGAGLAFMGCETHVHQDGQPARVKVEPAKPPVNVNVEVKPANPDRPAAKVDVEVKRR